MEHKSTWDYVIALQRAIEYHCKGKLVPDNIADECPHHAAMLNYHLSNKSSGQNNAVVESGDHYKCCGGIVTHKVWCGKSRR